MIDKSESKNYKQKIEDHFDKQAYKGNLKDFIPNCLDDYSRNPFDYILNAYCKNLNDKIILDYCCGTGINSVLLSKNGAKIVGIDFSKQSINLAKKKFEKLNLKNYNFMEMDAHTLDFSDNYFDYIICYKSLLYLNLDKAFKELNRVLKKDGKLIILENIGDNFIFNYYRYFKHLLISKKYASELNKIKIKDFNIAKKYFKCVDSSFFDFFMIFGKFIKDKFRINISHSFLKSLDKILLKNLKLYFLAFTVVKIYKKNSDEI